MAKWVTSTDQFGNDRAIYNDGVLRGYLQDCDGDFVAWSIHRNNPDELIASGEVAADGSTIECEKNAWEDAKRLASIIICKTSRN